MDKESRFPHRAARSSSSLDVLSTPRGKLQRHLHRGEYDILRHAPIFESDFIQVTRRGEVVDVHNHVRTLTMGIASTSPTDPLPDIVLLARPATATATGWEEPAGRSKVTPGKRRKAAKQAKALELTRLLPLKFVRISVHDCEKQQLRLKFATGRTCYLQLSCPLDDREDLFACWENLVRLLQTPVESYNSTYTALAGDAACTPGFEEEDRGSLAEAGFQEEKHQDQVSISSLCVASEVAGAISAAFSGGEGLQYDSHGFTAMPDAATPNPKPTELDQVSASGEEAGTTAGTLSMAITTSAAPEQPSTALAGAASKDPGGSSTSIATAGAAHASPQSITTALAGAANRPSEWPSDTSLCPETSRIVPRVNAQPTHKIVGDIEDDSATESLISTLPKEGSVSEKAGRQPRGSPARAEACKSRRGGRERRERDRALRGPRHRRATESHHKPGGDKILEKPSSWFLARQRNDKKEPGFSSQGGRRPVTTHKDIGHAPIAKDSRTSHKSGRSSSTSSLGSAAKRLSRIGSFLKNLRANLTTKAVASPHGKDVGNLAQTTERNPLEGITEIGESGQGLEMIDSSVSEVMETAAFEPYSWDPESEAAKWTRAQGRIPGEPIQLSCLRFK